MKTMDKRQAGGVARRVLRAAMGATLLLQAGALLVATTAPVSAAAAETTPARTGRETAEAIFQKPVFGGAVLSPDGRRVAFRTAVKGQFSRLAVMELDTMKPSIVASAEDADIGEIFWINNQRLAYNLGVWELPPEDRRFNPGLFAVNADGSQFRQLVETLGAFVKSGENSKLLPQSTWPLSGVGLKQSDDIWVVRPQTFDKAAPSDFLLQRLNTLTGRTVDVDAPKDSVEFAFDPAGELRAVLTSKGQRRAMLFKQTDGSWKTLAEADVLDAAFSPLLVDGQGRLLVNTRAGGDKMGVYVWDMATNAPQLPALVASPDYDLSAAPVWAGQNLAGVRYVSDAHVTQWFDERRKALQASMDKALPNTVNELAVARHGDSPWVLVNAFSDKEPGLSLLYNSETRKLSRLGQLRPDLKGVPMGAMDLVRVTARDGLPVPAWLTLPPGSDGKNLPLVLWVHGGPWVRGAQWGWNPEVQFLASRGYAVLQPEFRGSAGFGDKHFRAGLKQWGLAMQDDLADAVRWAVDKGVADPKRVCIAGASYGGYAAMMGPIKHPELYRCAVNWVGVTDQSLMFSVHWSDFGKDVKGWVLPRLMGDPKADAAQFEANSPLAQAARFKVPVLMAYGAKDQRVPLVHGEKMRDALKAHNRDVRWIVYPEAGHGWFDPPTQIDFWTQVDGFLAQHIGAK